MIVIQAGHLNIGENCNWGLRDDAGHDGEVAAVVAVCQRTAAALTGRGIPVMVTDANFNCLDAARRDYQAVVSVHAGAPPAVGVGHPDQDGAAPSSQQLAAAIAKRYTEKTGQTVGENARGAIDHYLFQVLSAGTPWALVELGDVAFVSEHVDQVVEGLAVGLLDMLGVPETEPVPQWRANLQAHAATVVLNRPVRQISLATGIAGNPVEGVLQVAFVTQVGDVAYYVPASTAEGADPPVGWVRSEVDAAAGVKLPAAPAPAVPPPAPEPPPAPRAPALSAAPEPAPAPPDASEQAPPASPASVRLLALLHGLQDAVPDLIRELQGRE